MAINNVGDIFTEFLIRNNRTTTDSFITDAMLQDWTRMSHTWASSQHKFPFTEGRVSTTFSATEEWNFEGYKADSFRLMQIGGKRLKKLDFRNYQIFREEEPSSDERVFADFGRTVFINPNVDLAGTLTAWGQYEPVIDPTDLTAITIFSGFDEEGNEAILEKMTAYLKRREHIPNEAELHDKRASLILDEIWKRVLDEQYQYQTHPDSGGMFRRFDVLEGDYQEEIFRKDQF